MATAPIAPTQITPGATFEEPAPLTPGQKQTVDQLVAAGATSLPPAERPGSDTRGIAPGTPSIDLRGTVRVGPYEPMDDEYGARLEQRDAAALDAEEADLAAEADEIEAAVRTQPLRTQPLTTEEYFEQLGRAGVDIGRGAAQAPVRLLVGAKKAVNETLDLLDAAADGLQNKLGGPAFDFDGKLRWFAPGEWEKAQQAAEAEGKYTGGFGRFNTDAADRLDPTSTGGLIQGGAQFLTGWATGGRVLKGWSTASKGGQLVKAMVQGAIADFSAFDPHEARLSDWLAKMSPEQAKPFFEFLASDPNDSEVEGRLKNAIEGMGLGAATEAVMAGLRALRAARAAKAMARAEAKAGGYQVDPALATAKAEAEGARVAGDIEARLKPPKPTLKPKIEAAARTAPRVKPVDVTTATIEPNVFDLDFSRIETPEDIRAAISTMMEKDAKEVDKARGGRQSWATTREKAEGVDWVSKMAERRPGEAVNAAEITAFRGALNASATKVLELAEAVQINPDLATQFAFRRQVATHVAIQREFMGARAEAGRALQAFQMPVGNPARQLREIDRMLADAGGAETAVELAAKIEQAARRGDVAMNEIVNMGGMAHSRSLVKALYTNGLLSGLGTPVVNVAGNSFAILQNLVDRAVAPRMARAAGGVSETEIGEAGALIEGYMAAMRSAFRMKPSEVIAQFNANTVRAKGVFGAMAPGLDDAIPEGLGRTGREEAGTLTFEDQINLRPLGAAAWRVDQDSLGGRALDVLQAAIESPSNVNAVADDFFRAVTAQGELHAQAFRQVQKELRAGVIQKADVQARKAELLRDPTPAMMDAAEKEMRELTFTRADGGFERRVNAFRQMLDSRGPIPYGTLLMPFVRTPANIMSYALRHSPMARFMARYHAELLEGGATAEIARARWAIGLATYSVLMEMSLNGQITGGGPANKAQREALMREDETGAVSWQPYSIKIGDRWVSYERLDPLGTSFSLAADFGELLASYDWDDDHRQQLGEAAAHMVGSLGHAFFEKTMLRSLFDTVGAVISGDDAQIETMLKQRATGLIPFSSGARMFRRGTDPYMRETSGVLDGLRNTVPMLSEGLPPQRDLWGKERTYQSGLGLVYDAISPVKTKAAGGSAIDLEILDQGVAVSMPSRSISIDGESVSLRNRPDIYSDFVAFAGMPAFEKLMAVVTGNDEDSEFYYSLTDGPDGGKAEYIRDVIEAYRDEARGMIRELYAEDLEKMAEERRRARAGARGN